METFLERNINLQLKVYSERDLNAVCNPLKTIGIHHLHYIRIYQDGSRISIAQNKAWVEHFYKKKLYNFSYLAKNFFYPNHFIAWRDINESSIVIQERNFFGIYNDGISLIINNQNYCNCYHFAVSHPEKIDLLLHERDLLYQYVNYFNVKMSSTIKELLKYKLPISISSSKSHITMKKDLKEKFIKDIQCSNLYIDEFEAYLTAKELAIVKAYFQIFSYKGIANYLSISERTVESHINNFKKKLGCKKIAKALHILSKIPLLS